MFFAVVDVFSAVDSSPAQGTLALVVGYPVHTSGAVLTRIELLCAESDLLRTEFTSESGRTGAPAAGRIFAVK